MPLGPFLCTCYPLQSAPTCRPSTLKVLYRPADLVPLWPRTLAKRPPWRCQASRLWLFTPRACQVHLLLPCRPGILDGGGGGPVGHCPGCHCAPEEPGRQGQG